jgi:hypothetical protein
MSPALPTFFGVPQRSSPLKIVAMLLVAVLLSACGAARAARDTGQLFDKYGCLARDFKGEKPCPEQD